jgi:hypothetical protein
LFLFLNSISSCLSTSCSGGTQFPYLQHSDFVLGFPLHLHHGNEHSVSSWGVLALWCDQGDSSLPSLDCLQHIIVPAGPPAGLPHR